MFKISRHWATPLTASAFVVMAVTGGLMFFHLDLGLNKLAHEWLGWLMVAAVAAHAAVNWPALRRYLVGSRTAQALLGLAVATLVASAVAPVAESASPPVLALRAIGHAPLRDVAPLTGRPLDQVQAQLQALGLPARDGAQTLDELVGTDRERMGQALRALFASGKT